MKLGISQLTIDPTIDVRQKLDEETIQQYMDSFTELPPVVVFETDGEFLLADGFHRVVAAQRLGVSEIEAEVKRGNRDDALEYAAYANTRHGKPLTTNERREAIRRLKLLHPDWGAGRIASLLGCGEHPVLTVSRADDVKRGVPMGTSLSERHLEEISFAPREHWNDLMKAAEKRGWGTSETAKAVQNIKDDSLPLEHKRAILEGRTEPITKIEGEPAILPDTIRRYVAEEKEKSSVTNLENALLQLADLRRFSAKEIVDGLEVERLQKLVKELPAYIEFQEEIVTLAKEKLEIWR